MTRSIDTEYVLQVYLCDSAAFATVGATHSGTQ